MTSNSIQYMANLEQQRHYLATEAENHRNNVIMEGIKAGELAVSQRNAAVKEKEQAVNAARAAADIKKTKADTRKSKAETKKVKAEAKKVKADIKVSKAQVKKTKAETKNVKKDTAKKAREIKHISVVEAQEQQKIANESRRISVQENFNNAKVSLEKEANKIKKYSNQTDRKRLSHQKIKDSFDNPALLAYYGLLDEGSTGNKLRSSVEDAFKKVEDEIDKRGGIDGISEWVVKHQNQFLLDSADFFGFSNLVEEVEKIFKGIVKTPII